ncbi:MAG TPA: glycosyltransferase N-terminal domain-containing protein, partial [Gammaproteobacteria bacterium]|nr:glycosyltransferase N-terminal domain-containing protein [Gammaproteobacteria bacterium]
MSVLLDFFYLLAAVLASPWIAYRLIGRGDWRELAARFGGGLGKPLRDCIWLHGSSAGEIAVLAPLVHLLEQSEIDNPLVISAYSSTGVAAARKAFPQHRVIVFPFDLSFVVRRVLRHLDPRLIVIVESEYWPNFLRAAGRGRVPVAVVNAKMSEKSFRFHAMTRIVPLLLRRLTLFAVQTSTHEQRLRALGIAADRIRVTGNMKYDLAAAAGSSGAAGHLRERLGFADDDVVIIGGSVHEREDAALIDAYVRIKRDH